MLRRFFRRTQKILEARDLKDKLVGTTGLFLTLFFALITAMILLLLFSRNPGASIFNFFFGPFMNLYNLGNMLNMATSLILGSLGILLAFRASVFNLGGEGQLYAGALAAAAIALALPASGGFSGILLSLLGASALGALLSGISGYLKMKWEVNELISSYLISAALILICDHLITGPMQDPQSSLLTTRTIAQGYWLPKLLNPSHLNLGILVALAGVVIVAIFLFRTRAGYELRMCGYNRDFARYGGIHTGLYLVLPMVMSGGFHGLAGGIALLGTHHRVIQGFSAGIGWSGIAVALIAREHPAAVIPAALFYAYLQAGARAAMIHSGVSLELVSVVQAVIFYLVTAQGLFAFLTRRGKFLRRRQS
jgi:simple sugar transport system permease protein